MNEMDKIFVILLAGNAIVSILYLACGTLFFPNGPSGKSGYLIKAVIMLLCPVVGPAFFLASQMFYEVFFKQDVDLEDVIFSKERVKTQVRADEEREGNLVPIEEALAICDKDSLRTLVMNVVRGDVEQSLASIALALNSEDTETSHYAASVLRDALNDFRQHAQELYVTMKRFLEQDDLTEAADYAGTLIEYMNGVLCQEVFHDLEQQTYVGMMEEAAALLYERAREKVTVKQVEWICLRLLKIKDYDKVKLWCERSTELFPEALSTYTCQLKLYFTIQKKEKFFEVLNQLKQSDIVLDRETLSLVRTFS